MEKMSAAAKVDQERLFGSGVDLFKSYYAALAVRNILRNIGVRSSYDSDWFRAVARFLTMAEVSMIYDKIMAPEKRREMASSSRFRTPPELSNDDPDEVLSFLSKNLLSRKKMWRMASKLYDARVEEFKAMLDAPDHTPSAVELRVREMTELFSLNEQEVHIIMAVFLSENRFVDLGDFDIARFNSGEKISSLARILGIMDVEAAALLDDSHNIRKFGLLDNTLELDSTFLSYLAGISSKPLAERFWSKYEGDVLPWNFHGKLAENNGAVIKKMIASKKVDSGVACLLYGVPGSGKTSFCASLAADLGKDLYFIAQNDNDSRRMSYSAAFRYAALAVAQKQLDPEKSILVIDECDKLVENSSLGGGLLARIFGGDLAGSRDGETKGQLNNVLDQNKHIVFFVCNSRQEAIDPSSRRRFDYSIFFDDLSAAARSHIWHNALKFYNCEGKLSQTFIDKISSRYPVNPGGISVAVKNAALICEMDKDKDFEQEVMVFLKAHCALLGIPESLEELMEPARDYSLEGLNIRSGIKLPRLIEVCRNFLKNSNDISLNRDQPRMNLLLHGVPGSGKTEFVKYLAKQLDKKLCVKNASDLLNMYVGGTEQRIAAAFAEAEDSILFIDEGDSMLSSRENAVRNWEVSQVTTLLACMETFRGIFVVGSNMVQRFDQAALRRFTFRLHFDYLENNGKEIFYRTYFNTPLNVPELTEAEKKELFAIETLTPSDFRNTRQQFFYLQDSENSLTNAEIIEALKNEVASKNSGGSYKGLGSVINKMGF